MNIDRNRASLWLVVTTCAAVAACSSSAEKTLSDGSATPDLSPGTTSTLDFGGTSKDSGDGGNAPAIRTSIKQWAKCDGVTDDFAAITTAFAANSAAAGTAEAFVLVVDCSAYIKTQNAIDRTIYIDNGSYVQFTSAGKFIVDNLGVPAFAIASSSNITLRDWNVEWHGTLPIEGTMGGYYIKNGMKIAGNGDTPAGGAYNDQSITGWLKTHRGVDFAACTANCTSIWGGGVVPMAVFFITGDTSNVIIDGLTLGVPTTAGGDSFIPMAISLTRNWKAHAQIVGSASATDDNAGLPHGLTFSNITFDGTYMGFLGGAHNSTFENIKSYRYGDLQDASGDNVGGINKWFPPPHLFYINVFQGDPDLIDHDLTFTNIDDEGVRVGTARDTTVADSGNALSFKLACNHCTIDGYKSLRKDGFMDVLPMSNVTLSHVIATFDSSFLNNLYPGWRWPEAPWTNMTISDVSLTDTAKTSIHAPVSQVGSGASSNIMFSNVTVTTNAYGYNLGDPLTANLLGQGAGSSVTYKNTSPLSTKQLTPTQSVTSFGNVTMTIETPQASTTVGESTKLEWSSSGATSCSVVAVTEGRTVANGTSGTYPLTAASAGTTDYTLSCTDGTVQDTAILPVTFTP